MLDDDETEYLVVTNREGHYSIWPALRALPLGWDAVGTRGTRAECLSYIEEVWTDMRPLSLRHDMDDGARRTPGA